MSFGKGLLGPDGAVNGLADAGGREVASLIWRRS